MKRPKAYDFLRTSYRAVLPLTIRHKLAQLRAQIPLLNPRAMGQLYTLQHYLAPIAIRIFGSVPEKLLLDGRFDELVHFLKQNVAEDPDRSARFCRAIIEGNKDLPGAYAVLAKAARAKGNQEEFNRIISLIRNRGLAFVDDGKFGQGSEFLAEISKEFPDLGDNDALFYHQANETVRTGSKERLVRSSDRALRFVIAPNAPNAYDWRMVNGLAAGLRKNGHEAFALRRPLADGKAAEVCRLLRPDVLFEINRSRDPNHPLPEGVRHVGWWQDPLMASNIGSVVRQDDIAYFAIDVEDFRTDIGTRCKVGILSYGVDEDAMEAAAASDSLAIDFSLCGYIPPPLLIDGNSDHFLPKGWSKFAPVFADIVMKNYEPLRGNLNIKKLVAATEDTLYALLNIPRNHTAELDVSALQYARFLDRYLLVDTVLKISSSVELYGAFWDRHPRFRPYHRGELGDQAGLNSVFRKTRINLSNNTHGFGLHSRILECMAVGGFILTHASPADSRPGGLKTSFEPGTHYGEFTPDTIEEEARRWLRDSMQRIAAGQHAAQVVRERHFWRHRAAQIIADLR